MQAAAVRRTGYDPQECVCGNTTTHPCKAFDPTGTAACARCLKAWGLKAPLRTANIRGEPKDHSYMTLCRKCSHCLWCHAFRFRNGADTLKWMGLEPKPRFRFDPALGRLVEE